MATLRPDLTASRSSQRVLTEVPPSPSLGLWLRVPVFTAVTVGLALSAHVTGGGALPGPGRLLFAALMVAFTGWPLALRQVPWWLVTTSVGAVQVGVHLVLRDPAGGGLQGHHHESSWPMVAAHSVAAVLVAVWLARGEAAVWAAACRVLPRLATPTASPVRALGSPRPTGPPALPAHRNGDRAADPERGPPVVALV